MELLGKSRMSPGRLTALFVLPLSLCLILLSAACDEVDTTYQEYRYLYTMLDPDLALQSAIVDRSYRSEEPIPDSLNYGVRSARIVLQLEGGSDSTVFVESTATGLYRSVDANWIRPCSSYRIRVTSDSLSGETRVRIPGQFSIMFPPNGIHFTDTNSLMILAWTRSLCTPGYRIVIQDSLLRRRRMFSFPIFLPDSITLVNLKPFYQSYFDSSGTYYIKVYALDSATAGRQGGIDTIGTNFLAATGAMVTRQVKVYYDRMRP